MNWNDAGFPNIGIRPWGQVLYALFLGMKELAAAMGYDMTKYIIGAGSYGDTYYLQQISLADYGKGYFGGRDQYNNNPAGMTAQFDYWFLQLLYQSFRAKYAVDNLVFEQPTDAQTLSSINDFLGEELVTGSRGKFFSFKSGFWITWAEQRYRLIRYMPIFSVFEPPERFLYVGSSYHDDYFKSGEWGRTISFTRQWGGPSPAMGNNLFGYSAVVNDSYWGSAARYLSSVTASRLQDAAYPFKVQFLHRADVVNDNFGTGLQDGQIWAEEITGFSTKNYSYTFPSGDTWCRIMQDTKVYIQVLPHNNPWITGGI